MTIQVQGEEFILDAERTIFWPKKSILLVSDVHLGKVAHFRKHGFPVPMEAGKANLERLELLINKYHPSRLIFLGDLFHSEMNSEWLLFKAFILDYPAIRFELVKGNHDILAEEQFRLAKLKMHDPILEEGPFIFSHHPIDDLPETYYNLCGHLHPGVILRGQGKQRVKLPCFYFGQQQGILPAFGEFTGTAKILPKEGDQVVAILEKELIKV